MVNMEEGALMSIFLCDCQRFLAPWHHHP